MKKRTIILVTLLSLIMLSSYYAPKTTTGFVYIRIDTSLTHVRSDGVNAHYLVELKPSEENLNWVKSIPHVHIMRADNDDPIDSITLDHPIAFAGRENDTLKMLWVIAYGDVDFQQGSPVEIELFNGKLTMQAVY